MTVFDYESSPASAHAPAIRTFEDRVQVVWFEGTRESHEDVVIKSVDITLKDGQSDWKAEDVSEFFDRHDLVRATQPSQEIWSLGNTIQFAEGEKAALATVVSVGGWAAASIARVEFVGDEVSTVRKLRLSPMLNRSYLVRNSTLRYVDGSVAIPAYFEMGNAFGELVRLDQAGNVVDKRRITQGRFAIQPEVVVLGPKKAVALSRNYDKDSDRLIASWTEDGGQSWGAPKLLGLPNPNSPVAATRLNDGRVLMAFNDDPTHNHTLTLAISADDGHEWERIAVLENGEGEVRYPDFAQLPDGSLLLVYSFGSKKGIRAHVLNNAWVDAQ
ncbi:sialidase family protein [uncultured Tateyamaria sp.]|uniref:exo-alpha-sialidase n=1 Tax=uncultured Tateyamaria sp. TaxID=455651 RepID=UPI0026312AED|nr:sialidase family protein [uncultured Tateyamaria sp.]